VYSIDSAGRRRGLVRRPFSGWVGFGLLLLLVPAALAAPHTVFPFFPLFPVVLFFFAMRMIGSAVWRGRPATIRRPTNNLPALPSGISKEKELLQALERHGEVTAVQAALETSLSVAQAEEMLSELANEGHVRVSATGGRLAYALWE
jgi:hypothetical protein